MILNLGGRTDIPAYYSDWFFRRVQEGYVCARNPYYPEQVTRYRLDPSVVDCLCFCTKNPAPMLPRLSELSEYRQFWFVTVTPYGTDIEPNVPPTELVMESVKELSALLGKKAVCWRYDPVFISEKYSISFHIRQFEQMAQTLSGAVEACVISFIDLYQKTKRNFPEARLVTLQERAMLGEAFAGIARKYDICLRACHEGTDLGRYGIDTGGCMTKQVLEHAIGCRLHISGGKKPAREGCECLLGNDIGVYNTCGHGCIYCYANTDREAVEQNRRKHDPDSPFLIGHGLPGDQVHEAKQQSFTDGQLMLF